MVEPRFSKKTRNDRHEENLLRIFCRGGEFGRCGEYASPNTEEFQNEYLTDIFETLWANPDVVGFSIWQMNDGRTRERFGGVAVSAFFGGSIAGVFDRLRRPKLSAETVRKYFNLKP